VLRFIYADGDRRERQRLREELGNYPGMSLVGLARDGQEAVQMSVQYHPDVVILSENLTVLDGYQAAALVSSVAPDVKVLLLVDQLDPETLRIAMRMGVRDVLLRSLPSRAILDTAQEVVEFSRIKERPEYQTALDPELFPWIIVVTGAKGGIGKTSISVNLAVELARTGHGATCLVDLYTQFGDIGTVLNIAPPQTLVDLAKMTEVDLDVIKAATVTHSSGLDVVLGATSLQALDALSVTRVEQVFSVLRKRYRFIVVDVPNMLHAGTLQVLESAHVVLLVCNLMDLTAVTDTCRWVEAMENSIVQKERIRLVLNRVAKENHMSIDAIEELIGLKAWAKVPNDFILVSRSANNGTPFVTDAPSAPVSQVIRQMAQALSKDLEHIETSTQEPEEKPKFGFFKRNGK
jgi:pilus assembly protein CpaE